MTNTKRKIAVSVPGGDLGDPAWRHRFIFGDAATNPRVRDTQLGEFLLFGAGTIR